MKPKTQKSLLYIIIPSFILIVIWIIANIYNHAAMTTITSDQAISIQPISDSFDTEVLASLRKRKMVTPDSQAEISSPIIEPDIIPSPSLETNLGSSESGGDEL